MANKSSVCETHYKCLGFAGGLRELYWWGIERTSETFSTLLVFICAPSKIVLTVDDSLDLAELYKKDPETGSMKLNLDKRAGEQSTLALYFQAIYMSNHQMYADWIYTWALFHAAGLHGYVRIFLKASLKHIPIAGPAMRLWSFIFLKNWTQDRESVGNQIFHLGRRAQRHDRKMAMLIFPEATLVSVLTRPKSKAYADKIGVKDLRHCLLPKSTGLLFTLRTLKLKVDDLALYDITIGYPGIPSGGYAQSYYTLQSIFAASQGPDQVSMHLRKINLADIPIGNVDRSLTPVQLDDALTAEERKTFDEWVRARWTEKDELMDGYYKTGAFEAKESQRTEWPVKVTSWDDWLSIAAQVFALYAIWRISVWSWRFYHSSPSGVSPWKSMWKLYTDAVMQNYLKTPPGVGDHPLGAPGPAGAGMGAAMGM
ncbi:BZ3500_MvSof-1268-A1-R1_Chr7-1g09362 [Microbotryum saponariae]|uniref:BZ3500_MvSof-1268-A1-R1_Chr7-1g09362 protein n=1 Tax=Microbotryum saponariae TaxID=289078 RepID=A0A2X0LJ68_9BASI|nr:BZ3501_MvSof-1269-A2-R1_Chr7-1g09067 [Microbotryum saponariae]SDA03296.1 BZ3500_MvSof-1268-A1-R1_Chr7-1g09362 [Microbotryum saponariae]